MLRIFHHLSLLLALIVLAGCAIPGAIVPGQATADELLQKLGKPTDTRANPQGGEFWDYVYGPMGTETWRFGLDQKRTVSSSEQILTEKRLHQVVPGATTEAQVRDLLGRPGKITQFREETAWEWRVSLSPNTGKFVVRFDSKGIATGINILIDMHGDRRSIMK